MAQAASNSDQVSSSLGMLGQENREGLENLRAAISEFMNQQMMDTSNVILTENVTPQPSQVWRTL